MRVFALLSAALVMYINTAWALAESIPDNFANQAGSLEAGSGQGRSDATVYFPRIGYPLEKGHSYLNSQKWRPGGDMYGSGSQCDSANYSYPCFDTFCETRGHKTPLCPSGEGHQGNDIRPPNCKKDVHWAVAVVDGIIAQVGQYSVTLQGTDGVIYRYLHLNIDRLAVKELDSVKLGQKIGLVSNYYKPGVPTTIHLHFEAKAVVRLAGKKIVTFAPVYTSLIKAYRNKFP